MVIIILICFNETFDSFIMFSIITKNVLTLLQFRPIYLITNKIGKKYKAKKKLTY